ncbi:sulfatase [Gimesia aquarii]|uniref:Lipoteichoic acid synthase 2 n=1 Tax=Gimesia aquarii TaxID=2527964 RepID=A0A517WX54_9PLAN|nr:sulfatase-like hydrolase/transferase [Gimesia aquarii]QDU09843.1 Lipoteichoic acid synthase 2 [Gimesia aquarii]
MKIVSIFRMLSKPLSWMYPDRRLAFLFFSIAICELLVLSSHNSSFWHNSHLLWFESFALVSISILTWASVSWFLWWSVRIVQYQNVKSLGRLASISILAIFLVVLLFFYISSWIFFWRTSSFLDADALVFGASNLLMIGHYIWQAEKISLLITSVFCLVGLLLGIYLFRKQNRSSDISGKKSPSSWVGLLTVFLTFDLVCTLIFVSESDNAHFLPSQEWWKNEEPGSSFELQTRLSPILTFAIKPFYKEKEKDLFEGELSELELGPKRAIPYEINQSLRDSKDRYSVIFIAIEALRNDVVLLEEQEMEVMPHLNQLARSGQHFTRCYAQSTHSNYADPCLYSSLYPLRSQSHHYYSRSDPWPKVMLYDLLKHYGYATAIYSSQNETWGRMANFLETPNLDVFFDSRSYDGPTYISEKDRGFSRYAKGAHVAGKLDDAITTQHALDWIDKQQKKNEPFVLCMNLQSSHFPYEIPGNQQGPFQPATLDFNASFVSYPQEKIPIVRNAYYNSLHYIDKQIGKLVSFLEEKRLREKTIIVVIGDQGEAFYENGYPAHAGQPHEPVIRVALVMDCPGLLPPQKVDYLTQAIDVVPTVCGLLDIPPHPCFQGIDILSNERPSVNHRLAFVHTQSTLSESDAIISGDGWKFVYDRRTEQARLHNLISDPGEETNLVQSKPKISKTMSSLLFQWRKQQLLYYQTPSYYGWFYPPRTPKDFKGLE